MPVELKDLLHGMLQKQPMNRFDFESTKNHKFFVGEEQAYEQNLKDLEQKKHGVKFYDQSDVRILAEISDLDNISQVEEKMKIEEKPI